MPSIEFDQWHPPQSSFMTNNPSGIKTKSNGSIPNPTAAAHSLLSSSARFPGIYKRPSMSGNNPTNENDYLYRGDNSQHYSMFYLPPPSECEERLGEAQQSEIDSPLPNSRAIQRPLE